MPERLCEPLLFPLTLMDSAFVCLIGGPQQPTPNASKGEGSQQQEEQAVSGRSAKLR